MIAALLLVSSPMAHISMNPNYGAASGGYFMATMKIPHGERGMHSTKFVLHVPRGVATVRPEVPMGWIFGMRNSIGDYYRDMCGARPMWEMY